MPQTVQMSWETALEGKVLLPGKRNWGRVGFVPYSCVGAMAPHQLCRASPSASCMLSLLKQNPLPQLVRASWVCMVVTVCLCFPPVQFSEVGVNTFILLCWIVALFFNHAILLLAWVVGRNWVLRWLVPYKYEWQAYLQNMPHGWCIYC